jgi:hypothetical protein
MPARTVTIRLHQTQDPTLRAWLTMRVERHDDTRFAVTGDAAAAVARDPVCFMHPLGPAEAQVLKSEILNGLLIARKKHGPFGCSAELLVLGGSRGDQRNAAEVPGMAYAVAATLALLHGLGIVDLVAQPRGGYDWSLEGVETSESSA